MVDLLDRFEREESGHGSARSRQPLPINPFDEQLQDEPVPSQSRHPVRQYRPPEYPIFKRQDAKFAIPSGITHMAVSNGWVTIVIVGNIIYRFNVSNPRAVEHHEIKREDDRIHRVFQDPTGQHLLISMESKECYYVRRSSKRTQPRILPKVKGQLIESVAWNKVDQSDSATGPILLGTNSGGIYETDIVFEEGLLKQRKGYFHELYQLMYDLSDPSEPITGLLLEPFPKNVPQSENKYYILATTPKRIYQFIGVSSRSDAPQFADIFTPYQSIKVQFLEIPGNLKDSQLHVWPSQPKAVPKAFAWLTGAGIYYGKLGFGDHEAGESLFIEKTLIPYSSEQHSEFTPPVGMALTQFHCILLYRDRVEAICVLNQKRVFEDQFNVRRDGPLLGMCMDPVKGSVFTYQKFKVWLYTPHMETRNIWKIFLEQGDYEKAKQYTDGNQEHIDTIVIRQAEHYFKQAKYQDAAVAFSQSQLSFEEITLKFIGVDRKDALKTFLQRKLASLGDKDSTQQTMLTTWLIELFLNDLGVLKDEGDKEGYKHLQKEFHKFLQQPQLGECLEANRKTVYDLISSHGATEDMVFFATLMGDYEKVISHLIQHYCYKEALKVLRTNAERVLQGHEKEQSSKFKRFAGLFYKFSPALMRHCPLETVDAWIRMGRHLSPKKLIPALIQCNVPADQQQVKAAIDYLEFCVDKLKNNERAIHNFLISFYAKSSDSQKLLNYLNKQSKNVSVSYDPQYALRLCTEQSIEEACVHIYAAMGLYEESVDLALKVDVDLARTIANSPVRNKDIQKKLWLKIAQHVIKKEEDIEKAMMFLQECSLLKIEDILPFFPDFVTIDHFKDAICTSLSEYNAHIDDLKAEMQGATDSAKNIRSDIQDIRNKCVTIKADARCQICETRLLSQAFYMFPCQHAFHRDCLIHEVRPHLSEVEKSSLDKLLQSELTQEIEGGHYGNTDLIKTQVDALVGGECIYCGDRMVLSIAHPFIEPEQLQASLDSWK